MEQKTNCGNPNCINKDCDTCFEIAAYNSIRRMVHKQKTRSETIEELAKAKAEEIVNKFAVYTDIIDNSGCVSHELWNERNKECALIAIDYILEAENNMWENNSVFWQEVRKQVEAL